MRVTRSLVLDDLGATVHVGQLPEALTHEVDELYGSFYSTLDYIDVYDKLQPSGAVVLERPRHVLLFFVAENTVEVLTRRIAIAPGDVRRVCHALMRAFPEAQRIHVEVPFPPGELRLPRRVLASADDMVVTLPGSLDDYLAGLGKSTRRNLRTYENRLRRAYPDLVTEISPVGERAPELFELFMSWKRPRMAAIGDVVYFDRLPDRVPKFTELLRRRGELHATSVGGRPVALVFAFPVGPATCLNQYAYDPGLDYYHLGLLTQYWVIADAIARGMERVSLLYGTTYYKERLGARPSPGTELSVFPSQLARLRTLSEAVEIGRRRLRYRSDILYWRARHAAGRKARALLRRSPAARQDASSGGGPDE